MLKIKFICDILNVGENMKKNTIKNIIIASLSIVIIILVIYLFINNKSNKVDDNKIDDTKDYVQNDNIEKNTNEDLNQSKDNEEVINYSEEDVINYVSFMENEVSNNSISDNIKDKFIEVIDFIFYDKEIKGYKFSDLTTSAKIKIISMAIKIDSKIEEKIPNYKNTISSKYNDIKDRLVMLYLDTTISICSNNKEQCNKAKEIFGEVKDSCKIGFSYIKDILSKGKNKLEDYYEIFKNS